MIFTDRTITIRKGESKIDEPIIVYRGDYELEVRFTIMNSKFKFMSGINLIESENASYGQLAILTPYGGNIFSRVARCNEGSVTFVLSKAMLDQIEEVGLYSFQIRLFDFNQESRVSIPPIEFGIEVREPITSEDHDNSTNNAIVGYSIAKIVDPKEEIIEETFDETTGDYNRTIWETGNRITEGKLNKIEDAINTINQNEKNDVSVLDKRITSNYNVLDIAKADKNGIFTMANMGQDIKEAMTGGSVAVVGKNAILTENIVDAAVNFNKTNFIKTGMNLLNLEHLTYGFYIDARGNLIPQNIYVTTDYIGFRQGERLNLSRKTNEGVSLRGFRCACFYDANYNLISNLYYDNPSKSEALICNGANVAYVKISFLVGYADKESMIYKGNEVNYIENFYYSIDELEVNNNMLNAIDKAITNAEEKLIENMSSVSIDGENVKPFSLNTNSVSFINTKGNLLNLDECLYDYYIGNDGKYHASTSYIITNFIKIEKNQFITLSRYSSNQIGLRGIRTACFYDKDFNVIEFYDNANDIYESIKCGLDNTCYVKMSFLKGYADELTNLTYGNQLPSKLKKCELELKGSNILSGKHIVGFGDSIVYGAGNNGYGIADIIAENNNMTCENKAVGGATILKNSSNNIPSQIESYNGNPDYIIIDGYINDCTLSNILDVVGEISPYYGSTFDTSTLIGQFETMLKDLLNRFHSAKIVYICVHHMSSRDDATVKIIHDKVIDACKKWSIPVVDLYEEGQLNTTIPVHSEIYTDNGDSTHPNRLGYDTFYIPKIEAKLKTL